MNQVPAVPTAKRIVIRRSSLAHLMASRSVGIRLMAPYSNVCGPYGGFFASFCLVFGLTACGARTPFPDMEPCAQSGATRTCENQCGAGTQTCNGAFWQRCDVAPKSLSCSNICGTGSQTCADNNWGDCAVEPKIFDCRNKCGAGKQACSNNVLAECAVEPKIFDCNNNCGPGKQACSDNVLAECVAPITTQDCSNDCGTGLQTCANNQWGTCEVPHREETCTSVCGSGMRRCDNSVWSACDAPQPLPPNLHTTIRDFHRTHPDFERPDITQSVDDRGLVLFNLGADDTPVYALSGASRTVTGPNTFNQWYHDVPGVNMKATIDLTLATATDRPGLYVYRNNSFFPIDNQLFGNEGLPHNYHFTLVTASTFVYMGHEQFTFTGDDDVWVFINRRLAIDLGGVHPAENATVDLNTQAQTLNIVVGNRYPIHIFFAERHTVASDFLVETSIADIGSCP